MTLSFGLISIRFLTKGRRYFDALRNSGLNLPSPLYGAIVQLKLRTLAYISLFNLFKPTSAPIMPPAMHALVSVSPPSLMICLMAFS